MFANLPEMARSWAKKPTPIKTLPMYAEDLGEYGKAILESSDWSAVMAKARGDAYLKEKYAKQKERNIENRPKDDKNQTTLGEFPDKKIEFGEENKMDNPQTGKYKPNEFRLFDQLKATQPTALPKGTIGGTDEMTKVDTNQKDRTTQKFGNDMKRKEGFDMLKTPGPGQGNGNNGTNRQIEINRNLKSSGFGGKPGFFGLDDSKHVGKGIDPNVMFCDKAKEKPIEVTQCSGTKDKFVTSEDETKSKK